MSALKPFIRITILSIILTFLLIYLGVKYHWFDHFKNKANSTIELVIPANTIVNTESKSSQYINENTFDPVIIRINPASNILDSMNKEQITEQCENLLSKEITDALTLELATVNCVVSNYQEIFQNQKVLNDNMKVEFQKNKNLFTQQCRQHYFQYTQYTATEKQLLVGMCVSDQLNASQ